MFANVIIPFFRRHLGIISLLIFTGMVGLFFLVAVIVPAWKKPTSRMYPSKFGYPALLRKAGEPLPVSVARVEVRLIEQVVLGEGMVMSEPVLVPIVPMDRILAVHVAEGDRVKKGDLLVELDSSKLQVKIRSAELAIATAQAELERVKIGSAYVLAQERPRKDQIEADAASRNIALLSEKLRMAEELEGKGIISRKDLIDARLTLVDSERDFQMSQFNLGMSTKGVPQSEMIAANAVEEARNALAQRMIELKDYQVFAAADGIVEQVLIHPGEYNQDAGRPVIVIASGQWFEANVDQTAINDVKVGDAAEVHLQALPGQPVRGTVKSVVPLISYNAGGPEATRPQRPLGTGAPEWPSTFRVRIDLGEQTNVAPGMTGFARISSRQRSLAVPASAVTSLSAGSGIVHIIEGASAVTREVRCGASSDGWTEILSGLSEGEQVIVEGQQFLQPGDRISVQADRIAQAR